MRLELSRVGALQGAADTDADTRLRALQAEAAVLRANIERNATALAGITVRQRADDDVAQLESGVRALRRQCDETEVVLRHLASSAAQRDKAVQALQESGSTCDAGTAAALVVAVAALERDMAQLRSGERARGGETTDAAAAETTKQVLSLAAAVERKADQAELQKLVRLAAAAAAAATAAQDVGEDAACVVKLRCLSCDRDMEHVRPRSPGRASPGRAAGLVERFTSLRPTSPGGPGLNPTALRHLSARRPGSAGPERGAADESKTGRTALRPRPVSARAPVFV